MYKRFLLLPLLLALTACGATHTLHNYSAQNDLASVKQLRAEGHDLNELAYWGTPLAVAARYNNVEIARYLIDNGADVNYGNQTGYESASPLHTAAAYGSIETAELLLANGADVEKLNRENLTPYGMAVEYEQQGMIELLGVKQAERFEWNLARREDSIQGYDEFLASYPNSSYRDEAEAALARRTAEEEAIRARQIAKVKAEQAELQKAQELAALEASLPPTVRRDKLMLQLSQHLKQKQYSEALPIFPKLEALPVPVDPSLKFFHGEALLETGQANEALAKLYEYVSEQGSGAKHYARALTLINQAESQL